MESTTKKIISFRHCEVTTYEKSCTEENKFIFEENQLNQYLSEWTSIDKFAFAYHDKDVNADGSPKDKHIHIMLKFKNPVHLDTIASKFHVQESQVERIKGKFGDALLYLTHRNAPEKYQYPDTAVVANFDYSKETEEFESDKDVEKLIYDYGDCKISKKELYKHLDAYSFHKNAELIRDMEKYRSMVTKDRDMEVLYICGASGSGKTTLAKFIAQSNGFDYFVSGSGKDVLDGYDKEECIILDDLRADVFTKAEIFKLMDNNTDSSIKSRYHNKNISTCKLMIVTSILSPYELYSWESPNPNVKTKEPVKQFVRRLGYGCLSIDNDDNKTIYLVRLDDKCHEVDKRSWNRNMKDVYNALGINPDSHTFGSHFLENASNSIGSFVVC